MTSYHRHLTQNPIGTARSALAHRCLASCRKLIAQIESIKAEVRAQFRRNLNEHEHVLELAVNEAEAMAWQTGFPHLFFPVLAEEKAQTVTTWHARQEVLRQHGAKMMPAA